MGSLSQDEFNQLWRTRFLYGFVLMIMVLAVIGASEWLA